MKIFRIVTILLLLALCQTLAAQSQGASWEKWNFLIGEWIGEGNGQPGQGEGSFSFQTDLNGKILVRKNHTVFPETTRSRAMVHDDLLIIYPSGQNGIQEAIYWDNEGNTIKYKVLFSDNSIVLTSDKSSATPRFRLSYKKIDDSTVNVLFEMAQPDAPEAFKTYLSGKALKIK